MKYAPVRDNVSRYLGKHTFENETVNESASIHFGILKDMKIKLSDEEVEHLFSLPSEIAIENWCRKIIMDRL